MQLTTELDKDSYYEFSAPSDSSQHLAEYLRYFSDPRNAKKFRYNNNLEKELLYYFEKISEDEKKKS